MVEQRTHKPLVGSSTLPSGTSSFSGQAERVLTSDHPRGGYAERLIEAEDGTQLFVRSWVPGSASSAAVLLTHGLGEYSARYSHVATVLTSAGVAFHTYDLRGHGRSGGRRGHIDRYDRLLDDLALVHRKVAKDHENVILYGHSLGAQITLNFGLRRKPRCAGLILASTWLFLAFRPHPVKQAMAHLAAGVWPTLAFRTGVRRHAVSRDLEFVESVEDSHLRHRIITARMFTEVSDAALYARSNARHLSLPLLMLHGGDDPVTDKDGTQRFFEECGSKDKEIRIYPGMLHETHTDIERDRVFADIVTWIERHAAASR